MLTIGIPKGENLSQGVQTLLRDAGFIGRRSRKDSLKLRFDGRVLNEAYLLRTRRVLHLVKEGYVDVGIVGEDVLEECGADSCIGLGPLLCKKAGLRTTRVVLFASRDDPVSKAEEVPAGASVVSEYPAMTERFFSPRSVRIDATPGGAEAEVPLAYRFGVSVVDTGKTLRANGLKEICTLYRSRPMMVTNEKVITTPRKKECLEGLAAALRSVLDMSDPGMQFPKERRW